MNLGATEENLRRALVASKYQAQEFVGQGGMASVWRGVMYGAAGFTRPVAIKRILPQLISNPEFVDMFVEEARVLSQLLHSNIVQVYDFEEDEDGAYYLVMEWVEGLDLGRFLTTYWDHQQRAPWPLVTAIGIEVLRALDNAHRRVDLSGCRAPVIHRDVTPQNILLSTSGVAKLTDFGLARALDRVHRTSPGVVKGKLAYLAPELTCGEEPSPQTDIFSMGAVLWESLAGRRLYSARSNLDLFKLAKEAAIPPLDAARDDLPPGLAADIHRALARRPEDRFSSAREFLRALTRHLRALQHSMDSYALSHAVIEACYILGITPRRETREPTPSSGARSTAPPPVPSSRAPAITTAAAPESRGSLPGEPLSEEELEALRIKD